MTIQATELLQLFAKANKLDLTVVVNEDKDGDYVVRIFKLFSPENFDEYVVITQTGEKTWNKGNPLDYVMERLDLKLEEQEQKRIKAEKRKELIARLTPEERELLNLN
jgi:phenylpyruvate tautomerase PptA (4-oxalocrotonate tautomerase family)